MTREPKFRQDIRLPFQKVEGQAVIVIPARSEVHVLDEVASFLWTELRTPRSAPELAKGVFEEFDVDLIQAERDVRAFLETLLEKGLVVSE
jgi:hypothetical protein